MSCNGCRVLRKGCSDSCILRPCLQWIQSADSQGHATVFVAKFFGRAGLMSFISSVPELNRPALFQSLLFEACGRTVNPINGAVGMLSTGNWHVLQAAVETILHGGVLKPISNLVESPPLISSDESSEICIENNQNNKYRFSVSRSNLSPINRKRVKIDSDLNLELNYELPLTGAVPAPVLPLPSFCKTVVDGEWPGSPSDATSYWETGDKYRNIQERKLLNLFV